ncbi:MAG: thioredoxin-disulfide reductase [Clostridia bacterium]|nr:thioredoxin-disulfide reductase [Clostridia bacterium]
MTDLIIIGAGPAGLASAIYALRAGLSVKVFEELSPGGQAAVTPEIENYPGIKSVSGADFALSLFEQAMSLGAQIEFETVLSITCDGNTKIVKTDALEHKAKAVIIANGAKRRKLNIKGEEEFSGRGVSYCAVCDGSFYKGGVVLVIGGGNTALEDALYLANICKKVYLVHRRDEFRATKNLIDKVKQNEKIEILFSFVLEKITGSDKVEQVSLVNTKSGETMKKEVNGVFVAIGLEPDNSRFENIVELENGYIKAGEDCKTSKAGIFAAGDTRTKAVRQVVTAASDGAVAATCAVEYINNIF